MKPEGFLARAIATWFGCGYWPWGPGTAGSAAAIAIAWVFHWSPAQVAMAALIALIPGIWASGMEARLSGREDPGQVVVDEVVGQWITLAGAASIDMKSMALAFVLFRLFDIWKPPPARQFERLSGGFGIMADDVMAGAYGALILHLLGLSSLY